VTDHHEKDTDSFNDIDPVESSHTWSSLQNRHCVVS
jgi:hypothetical protein